MTKHPSTAPVANSGTVHTLGDIARRYHRPLWMIRRLYERGFLPEPARAGRYRVVPEQDLPLVEAALRQAGYLNETN